MSDKMVKKHLIKELKEMVQERKPNEPVEEILSSFYERNGLSIKTCRIYYNQLVKKGEIRV